MAEVTSSIAVDKIKIRWEAAYASESSNRQAAAFPPGLYDGGDVDYSGDNIRVWGGTFFLRDVVNGFGLLVRDTDQTLFDFSSQFPAGADKDWYVGLRAVYQTGGPATTGEYFVTDIVPSASQLTGKDGLVFYKVQIHNGDTSLADATFVPMTESSEPTPYPLRETEGAVLSTDRRFGFMDNVQAYGIPTSDEKNALTGYPVATGPSATNRYMTESYLDEVFTGVQKSVQKSYTGGKFQITGKVYVGKGATGTAQQYLRVAPNDTAQFRSPLIDSTTRAEIYASAIYNSGDTAEVNPAADADADGYYTDPWVYLASSAGAVTAGTLYAFYLEKSDLRNEPTAPSSPAYQGMVQFPHSEEIPVKYAGTPSGEPYDRWSWASGSPTAQSSLELLLSAVNELCLDKRTLSATPLRVWRSGGTGAIAPTDNVSVTIYVNQEGYMALSGGLYLDSSGNIKKSYSAPSGAGSFFYIGKEGYRWGWSATIAAGANLGLYNASTFYTQWDVVEQQDSSWWTHAGIGHTFDKEVTVTDDDEYAGFYKEGGGTILKGGKGLSGGPDISSTSYADSWFTHNAELDSSNPGDWKAKRNNGGSAIHMEGSSIELMTEIGDTTWTDSDWSLLQKNYYSSTYQMPRVAFGGKSAEVAVDAAAILDYGTNCIFLVAVGTSDYAMFGSTTGGVDLIWGSNSMWSTTQDNASTYNVYRFGSVVYFQNKTASAATYTATRLEVMPF